MENGIGAVMWDSPFLSIWVREWRGMTWNVAFWERDRRASQTNEKTELQSWSWSSFYFFNYVVVPVNNYQKWWAYVFQKDNFWAYIYLLVFIS